MENKRLLVGESLPAEEVQQLHDIVSAQNGVTDIRDIRSVYFGPKQVLVTGDVAFERDLDTQELDTRITDLEKALQNVNEKVAKVYIEPEVQTDS